MDTRRTHRSRAAACGAALLLVAACAGSGSSQHTQQATTAAAVAVPRLDPAATAPLLARLDAALPAERLIEWRRHLHQHPELSNHEVETAKFVAARLREMGLEPKTGIARHGVTALIRGGKPGKTVALRADMDALPVTEEVDLPFRSTATATFEGKTVGVMHACGHDAHTAMLLAAAQALMAVRAELPGDVLLIFQPAEESVPESERPAGAEAMVLAGVLDQPKVSAIFGLHVMAGTRTGRIGWRRGPMMAAADRFEIIVEGRQTHGSKPWHGVDPIVVGSQIVTALQTIVSRQIDIVREPAVVTVGQFESGVRNNIIPERSRLVGTIRTFADDMQSDIHERIRRIAEETAAASGAKAHVTIERGYPVTANDAPLVDQMVPTLERLAGADTFETRKVTGAEDFSFYARRIPAMFIFLGITPEAKLTTADSNHSPRFEIDESALPMGARALAHLAVDWLAGEQARATPPAH
ncbi:MAG: amidohydrolase [Planctomycetes bacterium]|nr:amidohydrolase [Planctomycetota bacterium]